MAYRYGAEPRLLGCRTVLCLCPQHIQLKPPLLVVQGVDIPVMEIPELGIEITAQPLGVSYSGSSSIRSDNPAIGMQSNLWCDWIDLFG